MAARDNRKPHRNYSLRMPPDRNNEAGRRDDETGVFQGEERAKEDEETAGTDEIESGTGGCWRKTNPKENEDWKENEKRVDVTIMEQEEDLLAAAETSKWCLWEAEWKYEEETIEGMAELKEKVNGMMIGEDLRVPALVTRSMVGAMAVAIPMRERAMKLRWLPLREKLEKENEGAFVGLWTFEEWLEHKALGQKMSPAQVIFILFLGNMYERTTGTPVVWLNSEGQTTIQYSIQPIPICQSQPTFLDNKQPMFQQNILPQPTSPTNRPEPKPPWLPLPCVFFFGYQTSSKTMKWIFKP